jgi:integrative and conjugative element protein (TIGR02256 family)
VLWRRTGSSLGGTLWVPADLWCDLETEAQAHAPAETGGMLAGYEIGGDVIVTALIGGGPNAVRQRKRFEPDGRWQQAELERRYRESGRLHTYLGDWHSHPAGIASPSADDRRTARRISKDRGARSPHPVTLIAASLWRSGWELAAYRYCGRRGFQKLRIARCAAVETELQRLPRRSGPTC